MHTATCTLKSVSPYSQSQPHDTPKIDKESADDYEQRTWRNRMQLDDKGEVIIRPMVFKNCISDAAQYLSIKIPGSGSARYTKHFLAGVLVTDPMYLGIKAEDVKGDRRFVDAQGKKNSGTRVWRTYPIFPQWQGIIIFHILDDIITKPVFTEHLVEAGRFIGIGRFRPIKGGFYGRFSVENIDWV